MVRRLAARPACGAITTPAKPGCTCCAWPTKASICASGRDGRRSTSGGILRKWERAPANAPVRKTSAPRAECRTARAPRTPQSLPGLRLPCGQDLPHVRRGPPPQAARAGRGGRPGAAGRGLRHPGRAANFEIVPPILERHGGQTYEVIDLPTLFRRHPSVCLIDELGQRNPPGSRNPQRWQDVEDLLDRGIAVITASTSSTFASSRTTSSTSPASAPPIVFPRSFCTRPTKSRWWTRRPKPCWMAPRPPTARRRSPLLELRELALLLAADIIDHQLQDISMTTAWSPAGAPRSASWCASPRAAAPPDMLYSGRRNARASTAPCSPPMSSSRN